MGCYICCHLLLCMILNCDCGRECSNILMCKMTRKCTWNGRKRNKFVFDGKRCSMVGIVRQIWSRVADISRAFVTGNLRRPNTPTMSRNVHWQPPPRDWINLHSDGSFILNQNSTSCGGILRDHSTRLIDA